MRDTLTRMISKQLQTTVLLLTLTLCTISSTMTFYNLEQTIFKRITLIIVSVRGRLQGQVVNYQVIKLLSKLYFWSNIETFSSYSMCLILSSSRHYLSRSRVETSSMISLGLDRYLSCVYSCAYSSLTGVLYIGTDQGLRLGKMVGEIWRTVLFR